MTTTEEEPTEKEIQTNDVKVEKVPSVPKLLPKEIMDMMEYLSRNSDIIFKSQQRDEPELQEAEKLKMAMDVYQRNPQTFLIRFGNYLQENHLQDFARYSIADGDEEMIHMVEDYQNKLKTRQRDVKNRRYTALRKLIKEGEYFCEQEMMKRQPELYHELVGQYLSEKEKEQRDGYDVKNTTFSGILMHSLEQKQLKDIMETVQNERTDDTITTSLSDQSIEKDIIDNLQKDTEVPLNCRQQWGNFDNENIACSSSKIQTEKAITKKKIAPVLESIMADERELLRQEFISQMYEQFLSGQDKEFDYSTVDDNTQYDDLNLINQDKEDKYFEESDDSSSTKQENDFNTSNEMDDDESEDELDVFMSHLNKHHSLQKSTLKNGNKN